MGNGKHTAFLAYLDLASWTDLEGWGSITGTAGLVGIGVKLEVF